MRLFPEKYPILNVSPATPTVAAAEASPPSAFRSRGTVTPDDWRGFLATFAG